MPLSMLTWALTNNSGCVLQIPALRSLCLKASVESVTTENLLTYLTTADACSEQALLLACLSSVTDNRYAYMDVLVDFLSWQLTLQCSCMVSRCVPMFSIQPWRFAGMQYMICQACDSSSWTSQNLYLC